MNSSLQCLSNTPGFREYFARQMLFKEELNPDNPDKTKLNGVTIYFAKLLNELWNNKYRPG